MGLDLTEKLSAHFTLGEFLASDAAAAHGIVNEPEPEHIENLRQTAERLETYRAFLNATFGGGIEIRITSGYRARTLNLAIGGSATSDHTRGLAADWYAVKRETGERIMLRMIWYVVTQATGEEWDQLILYPSDADDRYGRVHTGYGDKMRRQVLTRTATGYDTELPFS